MQLLIARPFFQELTSASPSSRNKAVAGCDASERDLFALPCHATDRLMRPRTTQLQCTSGCLWITHDGDPKDVIIGVGHCCELRPGVRVLVHALEASSYELADRIA